MHCSECTPAILQVCHESRELALRKYKLGLRAILGNQKINFYLDPVIDTVYLKFTKSIDFMTPVLYLDTIQHLCLGYGFFKSGDQVDVSAPRTLGRSYLLPRFANFKDLRKLELLERFPGLKSVTVVIGPYP